MANTFVGTIKATTGPFAGQALWSNPANWSAGHAPANGDAVILAANGVDDLANLSLSSLTESISGELLVVSTSTSSGTLTIGAVQAATGAVLDAGFISGNPVTISIGAITGQSGAFFGAIGVSSAPTLIDLSATDPGETYFAEAGGALTLSSAPGASSILGYQTNSIETSTIALEHIPATAFAGLLRGVGAGDVLELPGSLVSAAHFGTSSLTIATNAGTFTASDVQYADTVLGETATYNAAAGLEFITFSANNTFTGSIVTVSGSFAGHALWSNPANWSAGVVPGDGAGIVLTKAGIDDIPTLSLSSFTATSRVELGVYGSLTIGTVFGANAYIEAFNPGNPETLTFDTIIGNGGVFGAVGTNTRFIDLSASDPGGDYIADMGGAVTLAAPLATTSALEFINFAPGVPTIALEQFPLGTLTGLLLGPASGDVLELPGSVVSAAHFGTSSFTIATNAGTFIASDVLYDGTVLSETATFNAAAGLEFVTFSSVACFCPGTRISTPQGAAAVEQLRIGDFVETQNAGPQQIKWIGHRAYHRAFLRGNKSALPIRIKANAIADNIPSRDLFVSPGHALCIDNALVHAARLVNGVSIIQTDDAATITYFHIELATHSIILAENCPAESFMDEDFRPAFANAADYAARYPGQIAPQTPCLPRLTDGFELHAIQQRLKARAGIARPIISGPLLGFVDIAGADICAGWALWADHPEEPVLIDIFAGTTKLGRAIANIFRADVRDAGYGSGHHGFLFPLPPRVLGPVIARAARSGTPLASANQSRAAA